MFGIEEELFTSLQTPKIVGPLRQILNLTFQTKNTGLTPRQPKPVKNRRSYLESIVVSINVVDLSSDVESVTLFSIIIIARSMSSNETCVFSLNVRLTK